MGPAGHLVTIKRSGADGPRFPLSLSSCLFGRGIECDIRIQLPVVSKQHCKIEINDRKAILFNFSSTNPTQVNGSAIDEPVQLKHGDMITIVDRSFRYENESRQNGSTSTEFPGQRREQASPRRVTMSGFSSNAAHCQDGKVQDPKTCSKLSDESVSGRRLVHVGEVGAARPGFRALEEPVAQAAPRVHPSDLSGDDSRKAAGPAAGDAKAVSRVKALSGNGELKPSPSVPCLENSEENESPFRKLYESMKEELDMRSEKENVPRSGRKSGSRSHCAGEQQSAGGPQGETPRLASPKARRTSGRSAPGTAAPCASGAQGSSQMEKRTGEGPGQTPKVPVSSSVPPTEATKTATPRRRSHPRSTPNRRSGDLRVTHGDEPVNLDASGEGFRADNRTLLSRESLARNQTPTKLENADDFGNAPGKVSSKKRPRSSVPANVDILTIDTEILRAERKMRDGAVSTSEPLGDPAGHRCPGSPGLRSVDVSNVGDSMNMIEGMPLKRRRVSFGGRLRPELFDENLPPNTPLKKGETPMRRRSLVTHTATTALKKIIKEQTQPSGKEDPSSEIHLGVTAQNVCLSAPARNPMKIPAANDKRQRSSEPSAASSGSTSPQQTDTPKRGGRRSSGPSKRMSVDRSQQEILQMIQSKRRSGASEANLIVAKSWADVVKLNAKQTQTKVIKHGPRRQLNKRQRRVNTPKKPTASVYNQFSTGHANSPCTIIVGKAHIEKVNVPARPYRMLNNFVFNKKIDFNEDLSGLTEMFKTPAKEKSQAMSIYPIRFSNSEDFHRKKFQELKSDEKPLLCTPENFGDNVFPSTQNATEQMSDKSSASPALRRHCFAVNENRKTLPSDAEPPKAASNTNKFRRSTELRNTQVPGAGCEDKYAEANTTENILGQHLRKTQQEDKLKQEMKESERTFETCQKNIQSKENSEKMIAMKRSRRSSELKCAQRADLITPKRLQETETKEDLVGIHSLLGTLGHAKEPEDLENRTTAMHCKSPEPDPVSTPTKMNARIKTPSQKVNVGELSALGRSTQMPGETTHSYRAPVGYDEIIQFFKGTPEQKLDLAEHVTGSRRRSKTPKKKVQSLEDLAGFKELFQTPNHTVEPVVDDKTIKIPHKSPKPEPVGTPGNDKNIRAFKETPEQKLDPTENVTGSRKRPRTPKRKVQPLEDLVGFKELFQTPNCTVEPVTDGKTTKLPHKSPKPERVNSPGGDNNRALKETPEQKLGSTENVTGSRKRPRTPKRKVQPLEDLVGFTELFQTPNHTVGPVTDDKTTKIFCQSPQPEPVVISTSITRQLKTPPRKVAGEELLSALRKSTRTPRGTKDSPRAAIGDDKIIGFFKETPEQKLDSAENVTGSRRRSRTPKRKVQPLEDLVGFKELFQTPNCTMEPVTIDKTTKLPHKSPKPELVNSPGGDNNRALKETPEQKLGSTENVTGSRKRPRTPKRKVQPLEDLVGFTELFRTPNHTEGPVTDDRTIKIFCPSPQPGPVISTSMTRQLKTPPQKVAGEELLSALRKSTRTPRGTKDSPRAAVGDDEIIGFFKETPEQKLDPTENVTGSRRRSRTPKRKVQPLEDLVGFKELFQTPNRTMEPVTDGKITKIPHDSPKPEPVGTPGGDNNRALKETPEQKLDSAENVTGSRKRPRTPKRKVQPLEDLVGFTELFQTPNRTVGPVTDDKTTKIFCPSPQPEPVIISTSMTRQLKTPPQKVAGEELLSALRKSTRTPRGTKDSPRAAVGDDEIIEFFKETPEQKLDPTENVTGSRRRPRTPKRKVQPLEDLVGFKELFQTPNCTVEPVTDGKTTKLPHDSPKPEPVGTPGGDNNRALKETPEQKLGSTENVTGSRKRPRTPKRKVQPLEDLVGFTELFQTPNRTVGPVTDDKTTKIFCQSPQPEPVVISTSMTRQLKTPPRKVAGEELLSALRKSTRTPRGTKDSPRAAIGDDKIIGFFKETPEQKLDSAENVTGSRRRSRTPKKKVQSLEDLAGFKELFQTPNHTVEPVVDDKTIKIPHKSPKPEPVGTPGNDKNIRAFKETPEQKLDPTENVTGSRKRPRTPKRKVQPLEDLVGFKELFQTPDCTIEPVTDDKTTKIPHKSPKPEPVNTPTSTKHRLQIPLGKVDREEGLSALKKPTQTQGETHSHGEPVDDKDIKAFMETPEENLDSAENVIRSRKKPKTPKRKVQPLEDLASFKELFQTPNHTVEPVTYDKTKIPCKSPQTESGMASGKKSCLEALPGKADIGMEPLALRKPTRPSRKTTRSHGQPENDDKEVTVFKDGAVQKPDPAKNVARSQRKPRTGKEKPQSLEDLTSHKELCQAPDHTDDPVTVVKTTRTRCQSPQPGPDTLPSNKKRRLKAPPGKADAEEHPSVLRKSMRTGRSTRAHREPEADDKDGTVFKDSAVQKPDPAENVTRSKRKPRTAKEKTQPLEDPAGLKELCQAPDHTMEPVTDDKTSKIPCKSPQAETGMPTGKKSCLEALPGKADIGMEPLALRKPTRPSRKTTRSHGQPEDDDKVVTVFKDSAEQKPDPAKNVARSQRKPRTAKEKTQPLEDPAGLKELCQAPDHTMEPVTDDKTSKIPCKSPQAETGMPTGKKSCLEALPGKADIGMEPLALRKPTRPSRKTTRSHGQPEDDDKVVTVFKDSAEQKPDPAKNVARSQRKPRTAKEKAQPLEDLTSHKELCQAPDHTDDPVTVVKTTRTRCQSPQPGPDTLPSSKKRRLKAPPGKADAEEHPSVLRKSTRTGRSTRAHREPEADDKDGTVFKDSAVQKPDPAENTTGSKRLLRTRKEKAPPLEGPAGCQELQTADPDKDQGHHAESIRRTPMLTPDRREPVKTSRRVLRAPHVKPLDDLASSGDSVKSQSESGTSQSPKRKCGKDGTVTGGKRLLSTCPQDTALETPLQKRPGTAPRERCEPPEPLITKKTSQRVLAGRTEPVADLSSNSVRTKNKGRKAEAVTSPDKGRSLRSRHPNKTSAAERSPEFLESAEKIQVKRNEKKAPNTSREAKLQTLEDGAKNSASGGQVREKRTCLRSGRQSTKPSPGATKEKAREKSAGTHVEKKTQEEKEASKCSGSLCLRSKRKTVPPTGDTLEKDSKQTVTQSAKRSAEKIKKEDDNVCIKKLRSRRL